MIYVVSIKNQTTNKYDIVYTGNCKDIIKHYKSKNYKIKVKVWEDRKCIKTFYR